MFYFWILFNLFALGMLLYSPCVIVATNGDIIVVDNPTLQLTGLYSGHNLFLEELQHPSRIEISALQVCVPFG